MKNVLTLGIIQDKDAVLLGMKKRGFGKGKWNGLGGKCKAEETVEQATEREIYEETMLKVKVTTNDKVGKIDFIYPDVTHEVHIYSLKNFSGSPVETEEILPQWFSITKIPYDNMWEDDKYWLPILLEGKRFEGEFLFDENIKLISHFLKVKHR